MTQACEMDEGLPQKASLSSLKCRNVLKIVVSNAFMLFYALLLQLLSIKVSVLITDVDFWWETTSRPSS